MLTVVVVLLAPVITFAKAKIAITYYVIPQKLRGYWFKAFIILL